MQKRQFRIITVIVIISLVCLLIFQIHWLTQMHASMNARYVANINSVMERSAYEELATRQSIGRKYVGVVGDDNLGSDTIISIEKVKITKIGAGVKKIKMTTRIDSTQMYYAGSSLDPNSLRQFDSILTKNLIQIGVSSDHRTAIIDAQSGAEICAVGTNVDQPMTVEMQIGSDGRALCRLEFDDPSRTFMIEMLGFVLSYVQITILLCVSFVYLLRTLFRQKSIEQMRQDFAHNITHELKTPISVAYAANDALINFSTNLTPKLQAKYLQTTAQSLISLSQMVDRILTMSIEQQQEFKLSISEFSFEDILQGVTEQFSTHTTIFKINITPQNLRIKADKFHIINLLNNLIENSIKYSNDSVDVHISAVGKSNEVVISIADNGIGIKESAIQHIFEKFYRVPNGDVQNVRGFGLGLYYVRSVVQQHGGTIKVQSKVNVGTKFTITLPQ